MLKKFPFLKFKFWLFFFSATNLIFLTKNSEIFLFLTHPFISLYFKVQSNASIVTTHEIQLIKGIKKKIILSCKLFFHNQLITNVKLKGNITCPLRFYSTTRNLSNSTSRNSRLLKRISLSFFKKIFS